MYLTSEKKNNYKLLDINHIWPSNSLRKFETQRNGKIFRFICGAYKIQSRSNIPVRVITYYANVRNISIIFILKYFRLLTLEFIF